MCVPCSVDSLENGPRISPHIPPQTVERVEKRTKGAVPRQV